MKNILITILASFLFVSGAYAQEAGTMRTKLLDLSSKPAGVASFQETPKGVLINVEVSGVSPGWHGVHFHAVGDCSDHGDHFKKSGGHASAEGQEHGYLASKGPHKGDLPNIWVYKDGTGRAEFYTNDMSFAELGDKDGSALMIHAGTDDHKGQPAGNAGDRVACGVLGK